MEGYLKSIRIQEALSGINQVLISEGSSQGNLQGV